MMFFSFSTPGVVPMLVLLAFHSVNAQDTLFVTVNGTGTSCSSLDDACGSIQAAVDVAGEGAVIQIGPGTYKENVQITTAGLSLLAEPDSNGSDLAVLVSAGGVPGVEFPDDVPADILLDIQAPNTTVFGLVLRHPEGPAIRRDVGILVRPTARHTRLEQLVVERFRTGFNFEPYTPGSRGLLVVNATHVSCLRSTFRGSYQDHIHLPTSLSFIEANIVANATRLGIVIVQDSASLPDTFAIHNWIKGNTVVGSASDGIQVQGDNNTLQDNTVSMNGGYGIHFCGPESDPPCVSPGESAHAMFNSAAGNSFWDNALGGEYLQDQGTGNYLGQVVDPSDLPPNTNGAATAWPTLPPWGNNNDNGDDTNDLQANVTASETNKDLNKGSTVNAASDAGSMVGCGGALGGLLVGAMISSFLW